MCGENITSGIIEMFADIGRCSFFGRLRSGSRPYLLNARVEIRQIP